MSRFMLTRKILTRGSYWLTMEIEDFKNVRKCHLYQIYADKINQPLAPLHNMASSWPFSKWGIQGFGMINPTTSDRHQFILLAIDYFTKCVEVASFVNLSKSQVTCFIKNNIICRYGLPQSIIMDNAKNINSDMMDTLCAQFKFNIRIQLPVNPR